MENEMLIYLIEELQKREVVFCYETVKGRTRAAHGTRMPAMLPPLKGGHSDTPPLTTEQLAKVPNLFYYDLDVCAWRSFRPEKLTYVDCYEND